MRRSIHYMLVMLLAVHSGNEQSRCYTILVSYLKPKSFTVHGLEQ